MALRFKSDIAASAARVSGSPAVGRAEFLMRPRPAGHYSSHRRDRFLSLKQRCRITAGCDLYKGPLAGACRTGTVTLSISGSTVLCHPAPGEEGTEALQEDGTFHLSMITNARFRGSTIAIDGKMSDGKISGKFVARGSFRCMYSFSASRQ